MKIVAAKIQSTRIPVVRAHQMAIGTTHFQENVIVELFADDGTSGIGEAPHMIGHSQLGETPNTVRVILRDKLIPAVLGMSPFDQEALTLTLDKAVPGNGRAKGAVMMAAYDLAGKALGVPVNQLLGGRLRDRILLSWSLPIVTIDKVVEEAVSMVQQGRRVLKVKVGRPNPSEDVQAVAEVRQAVGDAVLLRADANQAYDVKTAHWVARQLEAYNVDFLEQPVHRDDFEGMIEVTRQSPIPIMADEAAKSLQALAAIARHRAADYVSIYITGPGGLTQSKKMAAIAEAFRMRAYVGGALESIVGAAAGLHFAASSPSVDLGCEMGGQDLLADDIGITRLTVEDGALMVPTGPGLGIQLDEEKLTRYREGRVERFEIQDD